MYLQKNSLFVKEMGVLLFGSETLKASSIEGKKSNRFPDREPKPALDPCGLRILRGKQTNEKKIYRTKYAIIRFQLTDNETVPNTLTICCGFGYVIIYRVAKKKNHLISSFEKSVF